MNKEMNWDKTLTKKLILPVLFTWIVLALLFGRFDLQISKAVINPDSVPGLFGAIFGEAPGAGMIAVALAIFIGGKTKNNKKQNIPAYILIAIGVIGTVYGLIEGLPMVVYTGGAVGGLILFLFLAHGKDFRNYETFAKVTLILALVVLLSTFTVKSAWGRVRPGDTENIEGDFTSWYERVFDHGESIDENQLENEPVDEDHLEYSPWYRPQRVPGHSSFPSGHTVMGWMLLPLLLKVKDLGARNIKRIALTTMVLGWGFFVAISRVLIGAHFPSDVLFASGISAVTMIFLYYYFYFR